MIQFARGTSGTGLEAFAIKFFPDRAYFDEVVDLYTNSFWGLLHFLPQMVKFVSNADGALKDTSGNPFPPFIVMPKGESLASRSKLGGIDKATSVQVCIHRLLHALVLVFRSMHNCHLPLDLCSSTGNHSLQTPLTACGKDRLDAVGVAVE